MKDGSGLKAWVSRCGVIALVLLSSGCVLRPIRVAGVAMEPTLRDGEWAFTTATFGRLGRGDIVAFKYPRDTTKTFVMRIVGLHLDWAAVDFAWPYTATGAVGLDVAP